MKILLDECIPMTLYDFFKNNHCEVNHVKKTPWAGFSNSVLYNMAKLDYQIFVTTDRHFAHPEKFTPTPTMGVLYLRVAPTVGPLLIKALEKFLLENKLENMVGKMVTIRSNDFTIR